MWSVYLQDLGLATSRGRGKCKNPSCNYIYTNRHKPRICPSCGYNLAKDRTEKTVKSLVSCDSFLKLFFGIARHCAEVLEKEMLQDSVSPEAYVWLSKEVKVPEEVQGINQSRPQALQNMQNGCFGTSGQAASQVA